MGVFILAVLVMVLFACFSAKTKTNDNKYCGNTSVRHSDSQKIGYNKQKNADFGMFRVPIVGRTTRFWFFILSLHLAGGPPADAQNSRFQDIQINQYWTLEVPSFSNEQKCSIRTSQKGKTIYIKANHDAPHTQPYLLTFFGDGNFGPARRVELVFRFDREELRISSRVQNLSDGKFIAGVEMNSAQPPKLLREIKLSLRLHIIDQNGNITAKFDLNGSSEAISALDECRLQLMD